MRTLIVRSSFISMVAWAAGCDVPPPDEPELLRSGAAALRRSDSAAPVQVPAAVILRGEGGGRFRGEAGSAAAAPAGQVIVKFRSSGKQAVTQCPQRWLAEKRSFRGATADRSDSLDRLHRAAKVVRARSLLPGRAGLSTEEARAKLRARM